MACECENIVCIEADFNPCSEGVEVNIVPEESGTWSGKIEFNSSWQAFSLTVVEDTPIVLPVSLLNELYNHQLKLYDNSGTLVACYTVKARALYNAAEASLLPGYDEKSFDIVVTVAGPTLTNSKLDNKTISTISTDDQTYNKSKWDKPFASDTLTSKNDGDGNPYLSFYVGQIVTITIR